MTPKQYFWLWSQMIRDLDRIDTQNALVVAAIVNANINPEKHDPIPTDTFKMIRIKTSKTVSKTDDGWRGLMADMQGFTDALAQRGKIIRKKV